MKKRMTAFLCALVLGLTMIPASAPIAIAAAPADNLYVGYGLVNVTPTASVPLAGYGQSSDRMSAYNADNIANSHLLDDNGDTVIDANDGIYAACIAIRDSDGEIVIFFGMDLVAARVEYVTAARTAVVEALAEEEITVKASNIMVAASHTHSSPDLSSDLNVISEYQNNILIPGMIQAAKQAVADFKEVTDIAQVKVQTENMNFVRHYEYSNSADFSTIVGYRGDNYATGDTSATYTRPVSQADPNIYMLKFARAGGQPVVVANFAAHPKTNSTSDSTWGSANRKKVSSDYVGTFRSDLAEAGYLAAFFQGAGGNVNTFSKLKVFNSNYSDPTNLDTMTTVSGQLSQTSVLYGRKLADYAKAGLAATSSSGNVIVQSVQGGKIATNQRIFSATTDRGDLETYEALNQTMPNSSQTYYAYISNNWNSTIAMQFRNTYDIKSIYHLNAIMERGAFESTAHDLELNTIQLGDDISFATMPTEVFDTYCHDLRDQGTFLFSCANDARGYLPDVDAIEKYKCYEANTTYYAAGTGEAAVHTLQEMMMTTEELGLSSTCHLCGATNVQWEILNGTYQGNYTEGRDITAVTSGHYYMIHDQKGYFNTYQKTMSGNICLDMRGHEIEASSTSTSRALRIAPNANVRIANGTIAGYGMRSSASDKVGGVVRLDERAGLTLQNVTVERRLRNKGETATNGGVIYMSPNSTLNLLDSKVTGGVATSQGGGIYVPPTAHLNLGGSTYVGGNALANGTANNIYLETATTAGNNFNILDKFTGMTNVTLPNYTEGTIFGSYATSCELGQIMLDAPNKHSTVANGKLTVASGCPYCGEANPTWQQFPASGTNATLDIPAGHYYLEGDRTGSTNYRRRIMGDVCLDMRGHTFANGSQTTGAAFYVMNSDTTFNVFGGGVIQGQGYGGTGTADGYYQGGVIRVDSGATANLYGITVQRHDSSVQTAKWGGVIYVGGNLNLTNCQVLGGTATMLGDGIYVSSSGKLTLNGGTTVERNIYVDTTGSTDVFDVEEGFSGAVMVELPAYTDGMTFGTCGTYTGTVKLADDAALCKTVDGELTVERQDGTACQIVYADGTASEPYSSISQATADYEYDADSPSYIRLLRSINAAATIDETVYLDTNGFDITVAITDSGALYGMETATDDFVLGEEETCGTLTVLSGKPATETQYGQNRYLALPGENETYTFHAFMLDTKKGLRPYNETNGIAIYFQPFFSADRIVADAINNGTVDYGVLLTMDKTADGGEKVPVYGSFANYDFDAATDNSALRAVLYGMMPTNQQLAAHEGFDSREEYLAKNDISKYPVTGQACFKIGDTYILDGPDQTISLREAICKADKLYPSMSSNSAQKIALDEMWKNYSSVISSWFVKDDGSVSDELLYIGNINIDISDWFN